MLVLGGKGETRGCGPPLSLETQTIVACWASSWGEFIVSVDSIEAILDLKITIDLCL